MTSRESDVPYEDQAFTGKSITKGDQNATHKDQRLRSRYVHKGA